MNIQFLSTAVLALLLVACESSTQDNSVVGELSSDRVEVTAEFGEPITAIGAQTRIPVTR